MTTKKIFDPKITGGEWGISAEDFFIYLGPNADYENKYESEAATDEDIYAMNAVPEMLKVIKYIRPVLDNYILYLNNGCIEGHDEDHREELYAAISHLQKLDHKHGDETNADAYSRHTL